MIRAATDADAAPIAAIYNQFVAASIATFEETPVGAAAMAERIAGVTAAGLPWLVADGERGIDGYAFATRWKPRSAYRYSAESTIYLATGAEGRGLGRALYSQLMETLRERGLHSVIAGIALPNPPSVALHESLGFRKIGHFEEVGRKFDRWIDVGYWQLTIRTP